MGVKTQSFKDLIVWQKGYKLTLAVYEITKSFPRTETYGLVSQMRRAAISIPSNIAEGYGRKHKNEYNRYLEIASGSLAELETQYLLAVDLRYSSKCEMVEILIKEVGAMLFRMLHPKS